MLVADGGGGGRPTTNWHAYDVPQMWAMLDGFDLAPQQAHVSGWQKTFQLTSMHLGRMRSYRDKLATAWPPDKNEAARVYIDELDKLIASVQATYEAAIENHRVMQTATGTVTTARRELEPIFQQWQSHDSTMAEYESRVAATRSGTPAPIPGPPPLPPGWREDLNARARDVMNTASAELSAASYRVVTPPNYVAPKTGRDAGVERPNESGTVLVPPVIPPVVPRSAPNPPATPASGPLLTAGQPPGFGTPLPTTSPAFPIVPGGGPVPGVIGPLPPSPMPIGPSAGRMPGSPTPSPSVIGQPPAGPRPPAVPVPAAGPGLAPRPMPPGVVIGGAPGAGLAQPSTTRSVQRINPVGGVIGAMGAGARPAGAIPGSPASRTVAANGLVGQSFRTADGHLVTVSNRPSPRRDERDDDAQRWDPDNPWATGKGVAPVVEPAPEPGDHDPGPAIGIDR